jgi:hypothetical protein
VGALQSAPRLAPDNSGSESFGPSFQIRNSKRFFLQKEAKTLIPILLLL